MKIQEVKIWIKLTERMLQECKVDVPIVRKVLTSLIYTVEIVFNNATEFSITNEQTNAIVIPGQTTSSYNSCV